MQIYSNKRQCIIWWHTFILHSCINNGTSKPTCYLYHFCQAGLHCLRWPHKPNSSSCFDNLQHCSNYLTDHSDVNIVCCQPFAKCYVMPLLARIYQKNARRAYWFPYLYSALTVRRNELKARLVILVATQHTKMCKLQTNTDWLERWLEEDNSNMHLH